MLKKTIYLALCMLFIAATAAQAQVSITYSSNGKQYFTMLVADDWRVNVGTEGPSGASEDTLVPSRLVSAMPNMEVPLWFGLWVPEGLEKIENAEEYMASLGLDLLDDVVIAERKFETLDDMEMFIAKGTGKKEGEAMDFRAAFLQLSLQSVVIAIYIGPRESTVDYGKDLVQMVHSIQPVTQ